MKGTYVLLIRLEKDTDISIGSLNNISFRKGYYAYVGSGQGSLEKRVERHFSKEKKRNWHIDYLLENAEITEALYFESGKEECRLADAMAKKFEGIRGFGCSDCKCPAHLFYSEKGMRERAEDAIRSLRGRRPLLRRGPRCPAAST